MPDLDSPPPGPQPDDAYFMSVGSGSRHLIFPGVVIHTHAAERMMLSVVNLEEGAVVEPHQHPHEQMGILISGYFDFTIGGVTRRLGPGDQWRIPGGVPHTVIAVGGPAVAVDIFCPVRDDYL